MALARDRLCRPQTPVGSARLSLGASFCWQSATLLIGRGIRQSAAAAVHPRRRPQSFARPLRSPTPQATAASEVAEARASVGDAPPSTRALTASGRMPCRLPGVIPPSEPDTRCIPARCNWPTVWARAWVVSPALRLNSSTSTTPASGSTCSPLNTCPTRIASILAYLDVGCLADQPDRIRATMPVASSWRAAPPW